MCRFHRNKRGGPSSAISPGPVNFTRIRAERIPDQWISRARSMAASVRGDLSQRTFWPPRHVRSIIGQVRRSHPDRRQDQAERGNERRGQGQTRIRCSPVDALPAEPAGRELLDIMNGDLPRH